MVVVTAVNLARKDNDDFAFPAAVAAVAVAAAAWRRQ